MKGNSVTKERFSACTTPHASKSRVQPRSAVFARLAAAAPCAVGNTGMALRPPKVRATASRSSPSKRRQAAITSGALLVSLGRSRLVTAPMPGGAAPPGGRRKE